MSYKIIQPVPWWPHEFIGSIFYPLIIRYFIIPKNKFFNIYLHHICRPDDREDLHDHPWWSLAIVLKGSYIEAIANPPYGNVYSPWNIKLRKSTYQHRIVDVSPSCWTLFITGPVVRKWGFITKKGWIPWRDYVNSR